MLIKLNENNEIVKYPFTYNELRANFKNISFPEESSLTNDILATFNVSIVKSTEIPTLSVFQDVKEVTPLFVDNQWTQTFSITEKDIEEKQSIKQNLQMNKWYEIQEQREKLRTTSVPVGDNLFHADDSSRIQYIGMKLLGSDFPIGIMWKTKTGAFVEMTLELVNNIIFAISINDTAVFAAAEQKKAEMLSLDDPSTYQVN